MGPSQLQDEIVVVGAGIIGLYVSLALAERGHGHAITVLGEHLPGDTNVSYTSPWAGCNFSAISGTDPNALRWDRAGYAFLQGIVTKFGDESFVKKTPSTEFWDDVVPHDKIQVMSQYLEDFRLVSEDKLPQGIKLAASFTTLTINAPKFMQFLRNQLAQKFGVRFVRRKLDHISSAFGSGTKLVFNCTGNAARTLPGVMDYKCFPTRGQVVLVRAPAVTKNLMRHGRDYETYVIPRPGTKGHVVLGGYMQKGIDDGSTYTGETEDIVKRATALSAELRQETPEILGVIAGMRPSREGGARVERQAISIGGQSRVLVHNYGAGGTGYQAGWGMALEAVQQVNDVLVALSSCPRSTKL